MLQIIDYFRNIIVFAAMVLMGGLMMLEESRADWRKDIGIFRIGIVTNDQSTEALDRLAPFKLALSEALKIEVEFFRARNTLSLIDALVGERIEYAILPASGYALAWTTCQCVEPIAIPRSKDSSDGYHTILVTAANGPKDIQQIVGQEIGILEENSIIGHHLVAHNLKVKNGLLLGDEKTPFIQKDSAPEMLKAFANGEVKALIGWSSMTGDPSKGYSRGNLKQLAEQYNVNVKSLSILWKSDQIPYRPHIIRKKIHGAAKQILRNTLLVMYEKDPVAYDAIEPVYGGGFVAGRHDRFLQIIDLIEAQSAETKTAEDKVPLQ